MRDGVQLATDIYFPASPPSGPWPVLLIRTPYDKSLLNAEAEAVRSVGITAVVQDLRGRFASQGVDGIFRCEGNGQAQDGYDTMAWLGQQIWFDGRLGSWGGSALGITQYLQAATTPPHLQAMWVEVATPMVYDHMFFPGGAFHKDLVERWLEAQGSSFFLADIAAHPLADSFWDAVQTQDQFAAVQVPAVHVGGWFDLLLRGTIDAFVGYQHHGGAGARGKQKLIIGPWVHALRDRSLTGQLTYPANASDIPGTSSQLLVSWLFHYLGLTPDQATIDAIPAVQYYVMGDVDRPDAPGNQWRAADDWPVPAANIRMYLQPDGALGESCPGALGGSRSYVYDPADPCPTIGGATLSLELGAGPYDQSPLEGRDDVLVFTSPVLTTPQEITGRIKAHLWIAASTVDTDLAVRLTDVYPDGRSMLMTDGILRLASRLGNDRLDLLQPGQITEAIIDLASTSLILDVGHRLRISVTSSNWPRYRANPNDGSSYGAAANPMKSTVTLYHDLAHPSYIEVPDPQRSPGEITICAMPRLDAGVDGSPGSDAGPGPDMHRETGSPPVADARYESTPARESNEGTVSGCSCGIGEIPRHSEPLWLSVWILLFMWWRRRCR